MSTSVGEYRRFVPSAPVAPALASQPAPVSPHCRQSVTSDDGFGDWGKGADFRQFQRHRAQSVTIVTTVTRVSGKWPWADGLDALHATPSPSFLPTTRWEEVLFDAVRFSRDWGDDAVRYGWSELELFGCNPDPRARRLDNDGLVILLRGRPVEAIDDNCITISCGNGQHNRFRKGKPLLSAVPIWVAFAKARPP